MRRIKFLISGIFTTILNSFRSFRSVLKNPELRLVMVLTIFVILIGVLFYHYFENFTWVNAFYFSVVTLATVGYGDLAPTTDIAKIFTSFYILVGVGILVVFLEIIAKQMMTESQKSLEKQRKKNAKKTK